MEVRMRRDVKQLTLGAGYFSLMAAFLVGFVFDRGSLEGGLLYVVFVAGPLFFVDKALRSTSDGVERTVAVISLVLSIYWAAVLFSDWGTYALGQEILVTLAMTPVIMAFFSVFLVKLPIFIPNRTTQGIH